MKFICTVFKEIEPFVTSVVDIFCILIEKTSM